MKLVDFEKEWELAVETNSEEKMRGLALTYVPLLIEIAKAANDTDQKMRIGYGGWFTEIQKAVQRFEKL